MTGKKKWTVIDTLIVIAVIAAGIFAVKMFSASTTGGESKTIEATVLLSRQEKTVADAIKEGDKITVSLTEKDSGILKSIDIEDARTMVYNAIEGVYVNENIEGMVDIYATVELDVNETDFAYTTGSTFIKVGEKMPFRGKGYALEGFIISVDEQGEE